MTRKYYLDFTAKKILEDGSMSYHGYVFHVDGYIITPTGKKVKIAPETGRMRLTLENGKSIISKAARVTYELYYEVNLRRNQIVVCKDGDLTNVKIENLELVDRKEYFKDFEWPSKFDKDTVKKIRDEYETGNISVQKLADKYGCCCATIWNIVYGRYKGTKRKCEEN